MFTINKIRADHVIDFAAEELKKYVRMMMPECGDIPICYAPEAKDGFRLGLLEDFGLPNEAPDPKLDDVVHIDTDETGGILAGSNPRSVLFAVYRFLRLNGCRWLFAGRDGEFIPRQPITGQSYHKLADFRYRGHTTEGDPSFSQVMDYIDFHAKQELNFYALLGIHTYHYRHYNRDQNSDRRIPEPVGASEIDQWKMYFESELQKRGIFLADGNHELLQETVGLNPADRAAYKKGEKTVPPEVLPYLAEMKGERKLFRKDTYFTNMCMSRADWRKTFVRMLADFAEANPQLAFVRVPLADGNHNHCECEECRKLRPSDYLVMILNELDEEATRRGLDTKFSFSTYVDQMFPPLQEKIKNPNRFLIQYTPITRSYTGSLKKDSVIPPIGKYERNVWDTPKTTEECASYLHAWREAFTGSCFTFEYHFWRAQYRDPGLMDISRRIYEDIQSLPYLDCEGYLEDGSNISFFPNGLHGYIYAETLVNKDCDYESEVDDYLSHMYGKDYKQVKAYLRAVSDAFGEKYMAGEDSADLKKGTHFNPARASSLESVFELAAVARDLAKKHRTMPNRPQTVAYRILERHAEYCERLADVFIAKCKGYDKLAVAKMKTFISDYGAYEIELEPYLDFALAMRTLAVVANQMPTIEF